MSLTLVIVFMGRTVPIDGFPGFVIAEADGTVLALSAPSDMAAEARPDSTLSTAHFKTMVFSQGGKFHESGRIDFPGTDSYLIVATNDAGTYTEAPDGTSTASMTWRISSGGGKFQGAQGQITGNSRGAADGHFTDHQVYKIELPGRSGTP
jgi:hypothetical protein